MTRMARGGPPPASDARKQRLELLMLGGAMSLCGVALALLAGGPRMPNGTPLPEQALAVLSGSSPPLEPLVLVLVDLAWLVWTWIVASLVVELALAAAEVVSSGARWIRVVREIADRASFPLARRVVAAAFAVQLLSRGAAVAAAQPLEVTDAELVAAMADPRVEPEARMQSDVLAERIYIVRGGDTLWSIAAREYGSGAAYRALVNANLGRRMPDGGVFTARGVIRPGWDLVVPSVRALVDEIDGERWYTVRAGDTLTGIAATLLGDETAWHELFERNRGASGPDTKHALTDANVIWPGLRLKLPEAAPTETVAEAIEPEPEVTPEFELAVASTPVAPETSGAAADEPFVDSADQPEIETPLLRTPHALYPIALEPADTVVPADEPTNATGDAPVLAGSGQPELPAGPIALGGAGLIGAVGLALGAHRMRRLRRLPKKPESEVVVEGGFAEAQLTAELTRAGTVSVDPLSGIVARVQHVLDEYNLSTASIVAVSHGRSATTLTLGASLAEQALLVDLSSVFSERLSADVETWITPDQDVGLKVSKHGPLRLLPMADGATAPAPCLVPLGVLYDRQIYHVACDRLGHVLIASLPGHGADTILTSLIATMTARQSPDRLRVWVVAQQRDLPAPLLALPHVEKHVDPTDAAVFGSFLEDLRGELDRRAVRRVETGLVVVVSELTMLGEHALTLELLAGRASAAQLGVAVIAATCHPEQALESPLQPHFATRMVLRMQDEETSVGLLGVADAAFLGGGGRLLVRVEEREAVELYGYQVSNAHLERLVRVMRSAYPARSDTASPASSATPADLPPAEPQTDTGAALVVDGVSRPARETPAVEEEPGAPAEQHAGLPETPASTVEVRAAPVAPIQVTCFDAPRVQCKNHLLWPRQNGNRRGGDAKPWEFLLYLACQPAEGVSAEEAVEALWPGGEDVDATHRFRQLRYRLRHALATVDGAPETDGISLDRGTLRLDPAIVHSDAQEFLELVRAARLTPGPHLIDQLERARALYTGDLLASPDARRYAWLDERDNSGVTLREHFRRLFQQASTKLAEAYLGVGELDSSMLVYRELTDIDPADDRHWIALFRIHVKRGDRLGLLREERRLRAVLRELAAEEGRAGDPTHEEPTLETVQEFQRLLATLRETEPESAAV